ncbi:hypothetical protein [Bradyrhizobium lablabi]|uniref:hypothetical protein n=1 Tax=Bradyrhizobium lablabi TaxID=722472 RepID=UPI0009A86D61|nr:hypothetical protein [Bradyrhizobium lablabi]
MAGMKARPERGSRIALWVGLRARRSVTAKTSDATDQAIARDAWGNHQLCAVGIVRYKDGNGVARDTGFFRVLDDDGGSFVLSPHDAKMEYQD